MTKTSTHGYWNWTGWCDLKFSYPLYAMVYSRRFPNRSAHG